MICINFSTELTSRARPLLEQPKRMRGYFGKRLEHRRTRDIAPGHRFRLDSDEGTMRGETVRQPGNVHQVQQTDFMHAAPAFAQKPVHLATGHAAHRAG